MDDLNSAAPNMFEKRISPRIDLDYVTVEVYTTVTHIADPEMSDICSVLNLSESGMLFSSKSCIHERGVAAPVHFCSPDSIVIIRTDATVIHSTVDKNAYRTGVQFKELGLAERKLMRHFINKIIHSLALKTEDKDILVLRNFSAGHSYRLSDVFQRTLTEEINMRKILDIPPRKKAVT